MNIETLKEKLSKSWSAETSNNPKTWRRKNPSAGQCAVTAVIVNELFGGVIVRGGLPGDSHYWNLIENRVVDLTRDQFSENPSFETIGLRSKDYILKNENTKKRYEMLKRNLAEQGVRF